MTEKQCMVFFIHPWSKYIAELSLSRNIGLVIGIKAIFTQKNNNINNKKPPKNQNRIPVNATYYMVIKIDENKFIVILVSLFKIFFYN